MGRDRADAAGDQRRRSRRPGRSDGRASTGTSGDRLASPCNHHRPPTTPSTRCTMTRPSSSHIAHTSPRRGRDAATTRTRAPSGTARPIELPIVSIHNVPASARRRNRRVIVSGGVVPSDMSDRPAVWSKPHASSRPASRSGRRAVRRRRSRWAAIDGAVRGLRRVRRRNLATTPAAIRSARRPSFPIALPICRTPDRRVARRRRRRVPQHVQASPRDVEATTSTSVGRPTIRRHRTGSEPASDGTDRHPHPIRPSISPRRFGAASNTCWRRARRTRSAHAARGVDQRMATSCWSRSAARGRQVDAGVRGIQTRWSVLTDDLTFITTDGDQLLAWGLQKPLNIPGDLLGADDQRRRRDRCDRRTTRATVSECHSAVDQPRCRTCAAACS